VALKLIWSQLAIDDLDDIANFIAKDSGEYAKIFVRKLVEQVERIPDFPMSGRVVPEIKNEQVRERMYQNYRLIYRIKLESIEIVRIFHHGRQLNS
jgi:plasmid stabilization system protein ParE